MENSPPYGAAPRYVSLLDYLRVLRGNWILILILTLVGAAVALSVSELRDKTYAASAWLALQDQSRDINLLGTAVPESAFPKRNAAKAAKLITGPAVAVQVQRDLRRRGSPAPPAATVGTSIQPATDFIVVTARSQYPQLAASVANAYARRGAAALTNAERRRFALDARALRSRLNQLGGNRDPATRTIATLESLAAFATPVQIVRSASVPTTPVSSPPVRNAIFGGILGLLLGIAAAFVHDVLDRRLRGTQEIEEQLQLPVLGHLREDALGQAARGGNAKRRVSDVDLEVLGIVRANLEFLDVDREKRIAMVTSALPEEGKSTVAVMLAMANAAAGQRTLLMECDLRRPSLAKQLAVKPVPGLVDYLSSQAPEVDVIQPVSVPIPRSIVAVNGAASGTAGREEKLHLDCVMAGSRALRPAELLASQRFQTFLANVAGRYDRVVLDTSPLLPVVDTLELVQQVDAILFCIRASRTNRDQARAAKTALQRLPSRPTGLVVTGMRPSEQAAYGYYSYSEAYGAKRS
jgi:Mrp family chromosome partitioning ATPase